MGPKAPIFTRLFISFLVRLSVCLSLFALTLYLFLFIYFNPSFSPFSLLPYFLPFPLSFLPNFLPSSLPSFLPSFLPAFLLSFSVSVREKCCQYFFQSFNRGAKLSLVISCAWSVVTFGASYWLILKNLMCSVCYTRWAVKISFHWYPAFIYHLLLYISDISEIAWLPVLQVDQLAATGGKEPPDKEYFNKSNLNLGLDRIL